MERQVFVDNIVVKIIHCAEKEGDVMKLVAENTNIKVPKVFYAKNDILVQEKVRGRLLVEYLPTTQEHCDRLKSQLDFILSELSSIKSSELKSLTEDEDTSIFHKNLPKYGNYVLSHGDFSAMNILVDDDYNITAVIDWENAGYYPEYEDYRSLGYYLPFMKNTKPRLDKEIRDNLMTYCFQCQDYKVHICCKDDGCVCNECHQNYVC